MLDCYTISNPLAFSPSCTEFVYTGYWHLNGQVEGTILSKFYSLGFVVGGGGVGVGV